MDNQQQALLPVSVERDVPARMRDGTVLRADVYRPAGDGRWPVLLTRLPYGKHTPPAANILDPTLAASRGYVVIIQDTRGRFSSEGEWVPFRHEAEDGADTVAWAAALPYADGQAGMFGASYFGFTRYVVAVQQAPELKTIVPYITPVDPFDGLPYRAGAFELGMEAVFHLGQWRNVVVRREQDPAARQAATERLTAELQALGRQGFWSLPLAEFAPLKRHGAAPNFFENLAAPMDRVHFAHMDMLAQLDHVQVPVLNVGGWYDIFLPGALSAFRRLRALGRPTKPLIGPWIHGSAPRNPIGELDFGPRSELRSLDDQGGFWQLQLRWFDHWLKGIDTGLMAEAPVRLFVMGANVWRDEREWPLARAVTTPYYLRAGGVLRTEPPGQELPDRYTYDPADPVLTHGGAIDRLTPEFQPGPFDQRPIEARPDVLVYTTQPLGRDVEVTGPVSVHLWAASSAPDTDFVARLVDVYPDGRSITLTDGIIRARYRHFHSGGPPSLIEPNRPYAYAIDLWATSNVFMAGHRIGLHVTSSSFPRWDRNPNTGHPFGADAELAVAHQTILHDREHPSYVTLPLIPA
jgi:putative CocE/NonD family hydrolase